MNYGQPEPALRTRRGGLRLFLDSADPEVWEAWLPRGAFHGVTTNPLLLEKAGVACSLENLSALARRALDHGVAEIHLQSWGESAAELVSLGRELRGIDPRVVVKVPLTEVGLQAARTLRGEGCPITLTALFAAGQVVLAAAAGAAYAAPYLGRISDTGRDGAAEVMAMQEILTRSGSTTRLLVASLRSADQVVELARQGLDTFTIGAAVAADLLSDDATLAAVADFERAAGSSDSSNPSPSSS